MRAARVFTVVALLTSCQAPGDVRIENVRTALHVSTIDVTFTATNLREAPLDRCIRIVAQRRMSLDMEGDTVEEIAAAELALTLAPGESRTVAHTLTGTGKEWPRQTHVRVTVHPAEACH